MKKTVGIIILVAVLVFSIFCIIPNPLNSAKAADGGTRITFGLKCPFSRLSPSKWNPSGAQFSKELRLIKLH